MRQILRFPANKRYKFGLTHGGGLEVKNGDFVSEEKIKNLVQAGLNDLRVGVQSASPRILKLYNRPISAETINRASQIINKYQKNRQLLSYDIILDNPYEAKEDLITTLRFLATLPRPFSLRFYSLQLYPGTELYQQALGDSIQKFRNAYHESYRSVQGTYLNSLFYLMKFVGQKRCPLILAKFLLRKEMLFLLDRPWTNAIIRGLRNLRTIWRYWACSRLLPYFYATPYCPQG